WLGASPLGRDNCTQLRAEVEDCAVYVVDDVAEHFYARTSQEYWDVARDFSDLRPLADAFWIETARPTSIPSEALPQGQMGAERLPDRWGCLVSVLDFYPEPSTLLDPARRVRLRRAAEDRL